MQQFLYIAHSFILAALAIAPGLALAVFFFWKDKFEKEPLILLIVCFFTGALSMIPAGYIEGFLERQFDTDSMGITGDFISAFFMVGLVEELLKFSVVMLIAFRRKAFNEPYDGITYCVMVSLGFATIENTLYVFDDREISTAVSRMFLAVPAHTVFGVIMGFFVGLARFGKQPFLNLTLAVTASSLLHGTYDFSLFVDDVPFMALGAVISLIIGIVLSVKAIRIHSKNSPFKPSDS